jgi:hypothetical protein
MRIDHRPYFNTESIIRHYEEKEGVPIKYVCSTDLVASDCPVDVFFRSEPHPKFGNRYFGLYYDVIREQTMIVNADMVEELFFGMVPYKEDSITYSISHHDFITTPAGHIVDGGRVYVRHSGECKMYKVVDGYMVPDEDQLEECNE